MILKALIFKLLVIGMFICNCLVSHGLTAQHAYHFKESVKVPSSDLSAFYMDETPVTYHDFEVYVKEGGLECAYWDYSSYHISEQPVTGVSWYHAIDYCNWRSKKEGLSPAYEKSATIDSWGYQKWRIVMGSNGYRLPTRKQFVFAARGGLINKRYPWGDSFNDTLANYDTDKGYKQAKWWRLAPVTSQCKNKYGLYNMSGNIWHWCSEDYHINDPKCRRTKALAGGSWGSINPNYLTIGNLSHSAPSNYNYDIGFRCVRPIGHDIDSVAHKNDLSHEFYQKIKISEINVAKIANDSVLKVRLSRYFSDYFPHCINFIQKVDEQAIITSDDMAEIIISSCNKYSINPLFLTAIMISESGFGTVSFPRWYNNPMAYHWQNKLMANGLPVYESLPGRRNRKYKTLSDGFEAFCRGIRRELYYKAARKSLYDFHKIYVGYDAIEWMYTMSRVYKEVAGVLFEPNFPSENAGAHIYRNWESLK